MKKNEMVIQKKKSLIITLIFLIPYYGQSKESQDYKKSLNRHQQHLFETQTFYATII